jgi:isopenicillin N synthase-like dioxygenase
MTDLLEALRTRSYAVVPLPSSALASVRALLLGEAQQFFADENAVERGKLAHVPFENGTPTYRGCSESEARRILFARLTTAATVVPSSAFLPSLQQACMELHAFSLQLLRGLAEALAIEIGYDLSSLVHPSPTAPTKDADPDELSSILSLFRYNPGIATPCAEHVDYTLLTVAPFATASGLEVLDLAEFEWRRPEDEAAGDESLVGVRAIVMAGEALEYLCGGTISATTHRVTPAFGGAHRFSCPYLLYPRPEAKLVRWVSQPPGSSSASSSAEQEQDAPLAWQFMRDSQLRKTSAVYT